jgi:hypothetical protein
MGMVLGLSVTHIAVKGISNAAHSAANQHQQQGIEK